MTLDEQHKHLDDLKEAATRNHAATAAASDSVGKLSEEVRELRMTIASLRFEYDKLTGTHLTLKRRLYELSGITTATYDAKPA